MASKNPLKAIGWRRNNLERARFLERRSYYKVEYGLTLEKVDEMLEEQDNRCFICKKKFTADKRFQVDHNHETGEIRALLCVYCNTRMEVIDNEDWLKKAMKYRDSFRKEN